MKKLLSIISLFVAFTLNAQDQITLTPKQYDALKSTGQLDQSKRYSVVHETYNVSKGEIPSQSKNTMKNGGQSTMTSSTCDCMIPLDPTFTVANFTDGVAPDYRGDDGSTPAKLLPFTFCYYGINYNSVYINRNGNITFGSGSPIFTPIGFPNNTYKMIAPFWADVDTRNDTSGLVYYKVTPTHMIVKWDGVGYYDFHVNKLNTFQLIITDGTDSILPPNTNVAFCYGDMQWATGGPYVSDSTAVNGFGGTPATVGANKGNNINYFQVGRFDTTGTVFDGPYLNSDGIDFLDGQSVYINTCATSNIPPVILTEGVCDTIDVFTGDTLFKLTGIDSIMFNISVTSPEPNQIVYASLSSSLPANFSYDTLTYYSPGYKVFSCKFITKHLPPGMYYITVNASDNSTPSAQSTRTILIRNNFDATAGIKSNVELRALKIYPNPALNTIMIEHDFENAAKPTVVIRSVIGETISTIQLTTKQQSIDITAFSKGVYFVTINSTNEKSKTVKLVKE